jgi:hypothetical protein
MDFYEVLDQVLALLRSRGRVTYGALKRQFNLDDTFLDDVKAEIIKGQRLASAAECYRQALAEELGMRPLQGHCHLGLGTLHARTGRRQQAHAELSAAITLYRAMDMTFWLPQAEAVLAQVGQ